MSILESGIMMGFEKGKLIIGLVDDETVAEELQALQQNACTLYYVNKGPVDLFLIHIEDSLETSDVPFCAADWQEDGEFLEFLNDSQNIVIQVEYLKSDGTILAQRQGTLDQKTSALLRRHFLERLSIPFDEAAYEAALQRIVQRYEPFEMEEMAEFQAKI